MLMKDPKKSIALILSGMGPKQEMSDSPKSEDGGEYDPSEGYRIAAEEILAAIESKDASALMHSLKSFHEMCAAEPEESPEPESSPAE
jgi:hypothetical protein